MDGGKELIKVLAPSASFSYASNNRTHSANTSRTGRGLAHRRARLSFSIMGFYSWVLPDVAAEEALCPEC